MQMVILTKSLAKNDHIDGEVIQLESCNIIIIIYIEEILYFSAIICSTDSVAALTLIKPNKHPKLFAVVFGEGMVNDAVSIILFQCVSMVYKSRDNSQFHYKQLAFQILYISIISLLLGILGGLCPALLFKKFKE